MIVVVTSIPHTGTQFVFHQVLSWLGPEIRNPVRSEKKHGKIWIHSEPHRLQELESLKDYPWIVPMRHPLRVGESWKGRKKNLSTLLELYRIQRKFVDKFGPLYFPIDSPKRQIFLDRINERLGTQIETDWANTTSTGHWDWLDDEEIKSLIAHVEWYEHICNS